MADGRGGDRACRLPSANSEPPGRASRAISYHDTHLHRIGANYEQLPINRPQCPVHSYNQDAHMAYEHSGDQPPYAPNSYGGPQADPAGGSEVFWGVEGAEIGRYANAQHGEDDDFGPAGTLVRDVMDDEQRATLAANIVGHAGAPEVTQDVKERVVAYWTSVDADLAANVAGGLNVSNGAGAAQRVAELANRA